MKRLLAHLLLLALIFVVGRYFIAPTIMCWREGGVWAYGEQVCHMGTYDITPSDLMPTIPDIKEHLREQIDFGALRELPLRIPDSEETGATLVRTDDALTRFVASFPQGGQPVDGVAEARVEYAVSDALSGFAVVPFFVNYGGSGSFVYLGLYTRDASSTSIVHLDSVLIGDRVSVDDVQFERIGDVLKAVVLYKDRTPDEAMAVVPHVPKRLVVPIEQGFFGEPLSYDRTVDYVAEYKDVLKLEAPTPQGSVHSPLVVRGVARGPWFFEGSFPIRVRNADGATIAEGAAQAVGDWMTTEYVPFTVTLPFSNQQKGSKGTILFMRDNPSGLPEHDDSFEVPVTF